MYRKGENGGYLVIGGKSPNANSLNFDHSTKGRRVFYWGRDSGKVKRIDPNQRFTQRAADETLPAQMAAGEAQLRKEIEGLKLG